MGKRREGEGEEERGTNGSSNLKSIPDFEAQAIQVSQRTSSSRFISIHSVRFLQRGVFCGGGEEISAISATRNRSIWSIAGCS